MPKIRYKKIEDTISEVSKSGILNSNFKKHIKLKDDIAGKYFQTEYISAEEKHYLGNDYYNDNDTFVFEKNSQKSNILGLPAVPLESNPDNFLLTTDYHFIENNIVSLAEEESINRNHLTYSGLIQSPNKLNLLDEDLKSVGEFSSEILKEIKQNRIEEVFTPFNDAYASLYEGLSDEAIFETIDEEIKENYHIGNQKIINIELDFSNNTDGFLVNTLFVTRKPAETTSLESLYDKKTYNDQYTFSQGEASSKFVISSHFLPNMFWNEKDKRWEYNSQKDLIHIDSSVLSQSGIVFPNAITGNYSENSGNIEIDNTGESTNNFTLDFISKFIESSPITNLISRNESFPNVLTDSYGFPYGKKWSPTKDHLINLRKYISREFLLEKVSIEGNVSLRSEYPTKAGNLFKEKSLNEAFFINSFPENASEIVSGLNFYLLKSNINKLKEKYKYIQGYRKFNSSLLKFKNSIDASNIIDKNLKDIKSNFVFDELPGEINLSNPREIGNKEILYEGIKSTLTKSIKLNINNEIQIEDQHDFFFLDNQNENSISRYKRKNYITNVYNSEDLDLVDDAESLYFFRNTNSKLENEYNLIFNTNKLFLSKTPSSTIEVGNFKNLDIETKTDLFIDIKEKDFKVFDSCIYPHSENYVTENEFKTYSNLKEVNVTGEVPFAASFVLNLDYFDVIFGEPGDVSRQDVINNLVTLGTSKEYFSSYSESENVKFVKPDITIFNSSEITTKGLNISFIPESFDDVDLTSGGVNRHFFAAKVEDIRDVVSEFYKYFIIVSTYNNTVYLNLTALRNSKIVTKLTEFYAEEISVTDDAFVSLTDSLDNPVMLVSEEDFIFSKTSLFDKKRLFTSALKLCMLLQPLGYISKIKETFNNEFEFYCTFSTDADSPYNEISVGSLYTSTYYGNIDKLSVLNYTFTNLYSVLFKPIISDDANSQSAKFLINQRNTSICSIESLYAPPVTNEVSYEENISIFEGKFENRLNSHFYKNENKKINYITSSGKYFDDYSSSHQKSLNILKPNDDIVFGVSSFHGFNTQASFASLHKKVSIKLYGREIKPISKNESNYSSSIKKAFHGNDCLKIEIENNKNSSKAYKNTELGQIKLIDTIQPDPITLSSLMNKKFKSNRKCITDKIVGKDVKKLILTDKKIGGTEEDVIVDWHEKYYVNIYKNEILNDKSKFLKTKFSDDFFVYYDVEGITASYFTHKKSVSLRREAYENINDVFVGFNNYANAEIYNSKDLKLFSNKINNDDLLNFSIRDFFVNSNFLITDDLNNVYESKYNGLSSKVSNEIDFVDLSYNIKPISSEITPITLYLEDTERFGSSIQYLKIPRFLSFSGYSLKAFEKNIDKFDKNKTYETWCLVNQIRGAKSIVDQRLLSLIIRKGKINTPWGGANSYTLMLDNNSAVYSYSVVNVFKIANMPFMSIYNEKEDSFIMITPVYNNFLSYQGFSYQNLCNFSVLNSYDVNEDITDDYSFVNVLFDEEEAVQFKNRIENPDLTNFKNENYAPVDILESENNDYFIRTGVVQIDFRDFKLLNGSEIIFSKNENSLEKTDFIEKNYSSLIDKHYIKDETLFELLTSKEFTNDAKIESSFLNQKIYQSRLYKKIGKNFVKTNVDVIYGIKNAAEVNLNTSNEDFKNVNLLAIKSYNPVNNRGSIHYLDNFSCINSDDVLRFYENTSEKIFNDSGSSISKNYFEIDLKNSTVDFNNTLFESGVIIDTNENNLPLLTKSFLGYSKEENYIFPGKPIASLSNKEEVDKCKLFFFGYRNGKDFKFPDDKIDGFRYGVMGHDSQREQYEFNFKNSFGNFKDMTYYTQNYARIIVKNNALLEQHCVEKKYINEYYRYIDENAAKDRSTFIGSNTDIYSRQYYPYIESSDNSDLTYLYQAEG